MRELPIPMSTVNVQAIREDRKSMTRRVIKPQPLKYLPKEDRIIKGMQHFAFIYPTDYESDTLLYAKCPYAVGDKLYVKEALEHSSTGTPTRYAVDGCPVMFDGESIDWPYRRSYLSSIFMPKKYARLWLEVTEVKPPERLWDITLEDVVAEGIDRFTFARGCMSENPPDPRWAFIKLWDSINGKRYPWSGNWLVWPIRFRRELNV